MYAAAISFDGVTIRALAALKHEGALIRESVRNAQRLRDVHGFPTEILPRSADNTAAFTSVVVDHSAGTVQFLGTSSTAQPLRTPPSTSGKTSNSTSSSPVPNPISSEKEAAPYSLDNEVPVEDRASTTASAAAVPEASSVKKPQRSGLARLFFGSGAN